MSILTDWIDTMTFHYENELSELEQYKDIDDGSNEWREERLKTVRRKLNLLHQATQRLKAELDRRRVVKSSRKLIL